MKTFSISEYAAAHPEEAQVQYACVLEDQSIQDLQNLKIALQRLKNNSENTSDKKIWNDRLMVVEQLIALRTLEANAINTTTDKQRERLAHVLIETNGFMTPLTLQL